jgi:hypothetical protein
MKILTAVAQPAGQRQYLELNLARTPEVFRRSLENSNGPKLCWFWWMG